MKSLEIFNADNILKYFPIKRIFRCIPKSELFQIFSFFHLKKLFSFEELSISVWLLTNRSKTPVSPTEGKRCLLCITVCILLVSEQYIISVNTLKLFIISPLLNSVRSCRSLTMHCANNNNYSYTGFEHT